MLKYFSKKKYQIDIISENNFNKWKKENSEFDIDFQKFKKYWRHLRSELVECILDNPSGVDLPIFLGNLSIRVIDIDFKCSKDFLKTIQINPETGIVEKVPFITTTLPSKVKITWTKHKLFQTIAKVLCLESSETLKKSISEGVRNNINKYQKAFKHKGLVSKCEDVPDVSLFDTIK